MHNHSHTHEHNCAEGEGAHTHDDAQIGEHGDDHIHCHDHEDDHVHQTPCTVDKSVALLSYMFNHNKSHTKELLALANTIEEKGAVEAARIIKNALHDYTEGNRKLASALEILK